MVLKGTHSARSPIHSRKAVGQPVGRGWPTLEHIGSWALEAPGGLPTLEQAGVGDLGRFTGWGWALPPWSSSEGRFGSSMVGSIGSPSQPAIHPEISRLASQPDRWPPPTHTAQLPACPPARSLQSTDKWGGSIEHKHNEKSSPPIGGSQSVGQSIDRPTDRPATHTGSLSSRSDANPSVVIGPARALQGGNPPPPLPT